MLALIAGRGELPRAVVQAQDRPVLICALDGSPPDSVEASHVFALERLGGFLRVLRARGVRQVCLCGAVSRPRINWLRLDLATLALLPKIRRALKRGDDGALRIAISILEEAGFQVIAAHEAAPDLLPAAGCPTRVQPDDTARLAAAQGDRVSDAQGAQDLGQACVVTDTQVLAREDAAGTDAMLAGLGAAPGAVFYKAPKPGQDRRADLPVIGPATAQRAAQLGLAGLIIEAGGVMVLDRGAVIDILDKAGLFLWVRERPL
ncbi:LpxI family protein [Tropicibacter oceani]|uniref:UDP-2,3-diacylglucosamine diphosphatase LpxI n=1 Tax=Tropicibacter oceani TaxID=3058420 RepID=A0ABY8QDV9_9RHOB|nr:UDP-2,3-diacylglucosamine diphosphatase LpxI [Tropicibacter oceani]WGW02810.1 UDP-2,3-diacylglucosamine diphosphatase LpxI [Tropicibacter oceani]